MGYEYYKSRLNAKESAVYEQILDAIRRRARGAKCGSINANRAFELYFAVCSDHPELFYADSKVTCHSSIFGRDNQLVLSYLYSESEIRQYQLEMNTILSHMRRVITSRNEKEIERAVCNYMIEHVEYERDDVFHQNAIAALADGVAQCSGIAKATKWLLDELGIQCIYVTGNLAGEAHAWNIVRIEGQYYHLDVTSMIGCNCGGQKPYYYCDYNETDEEIGENHSWQRADFPPCTRKYVHEALPNQTRLDPVQTFDQLEAQLMTAPIKAGGIIIVELLMPLSRQTIIDQLSQSLRKVLTRRGIGLSIQISITERQLTLVFQK